MTKHAAYPSEDVVAAVAPPAPAGRHFSSFPPLKGAPLDCKKHAAVDLSASGAAAVVGGSWFESMKASSPRCAADAEHGDWVVRTRRRALSSCFFFFFFPFLLACGKMDRSALRLTSGRLRPQEKHPSALVGFESVLAAAKGKQMVMFLDYDGTLSPIVEDPDRAFMSEEVSSNLLARFFSFLRSLLLLCLWQ